MESLFTILATSVFTYLVLTFVILVVISFFLSGTNVTIENQWKTRGGFGITPFALQYESVTLWEVGVTAVGGKIYSVSRPVSGETPHIQARLLHISIFWWRMTLHKKYSMEDALD